MNISYSEIQSSHNKATKKIIELLDVFDTLAANDLFEKSKLTRNQFSKEIARLEGGCIIKKVKDTEDYRKVYYQLTQHGLNMLSSR